MKSKKNLTWPKILGNFFFSQKNNLLQDIESNLPH